MSDAYQSYLENKHAGFRTPEGVVVGMVERAILNSGTATELPGASDQWEERAGQFGDRLRIEKLVRGNDNEVYVVGTEAGEYIVRIRRAGESELESEVWAMARAREAGLPVAEVLLAGAEEHAGERLEFMVQNRLPGRPLSEVLPGLDEEARRMVWRRAGAELAKLHAVKVEGFYLRHADGGWDFPTWQAVMNSAIRDRGAEREWILRAGFTEMEFAEMRRLMVRYRDEFDCAQPVLCHGDYLPEHILVDEYLRVCGVIDFGGYRGDAPVHDLAIMAMEGLGPDLADVIDGYGGGGALGERFEDRLHFHRLALEMGYLAHHIQIPGYPEEALVTRGLRQTLEWLVRREKRDGDGRLVAVKE